MRRRAGAIFASLILLVVSSPDAVAVQALPVRRGRTVLHAAPPTPGSRFAGGVFRIGPFLRERLIGRNWHPGCPVGLGDLRLVRVSYWDFRGQVRAGPLVLNDAVADDVLWVFERLFRARFPIHRIALPARYRPPTREDWFNTHDRSSSFNCRPAVGSPGSLSHHSYGWAVDINPLENPYVLSDGSVLRRAAKPFVDRTQRVPGMIRAGDVVVR